MATYQEIFAILSFTIVGAADLRNKIGVATLITADKIRSGTDDDAPFNQTAGAHDKRLLWAAKVFSQPRGATEEVFGAVLAANATFTQAQILAASDAQIQSAVDAVADVFAVALGSPPA